jgi:UDP-N-acetylglucosamine 2-epimerase (non-hydrolysing)
MAAALVCFYHHIPFGHIEAGLRTGNFQNPFPEEMNRVLATRLAHWHFAPTPLARLNLLREGADERFIHVTGNTVIDALLQVADRVNEADLGLDLGEQTRLLLVTAHRRENFGKPFEQICTAIRRIADRHAGVRILYPVHYNPNIQRPAYARLSNHPRIVLCEPLGYKPFVAAMKRAYLILTDSGGVQEEAPALGKPVLVLRSETERPEAVEQGVVRLIGTDPQVIETVVNELLQSRAAYQKMARGVSPYGDGHAAERIVKIISESLCAQSPFKTDATHEKPATKLNAHD